MIARRPTSLRKALSSSMVDPQHYPTTRMFTRRWYGLVNRSQPYVFVLWGTDFDAVAATIFVGELRRLGKRVKLVGINMRQGRGRHGLTLVPDFRLDQALRLAERSCCMIVPASPSTIQQFSYDPRVAELLRSQPRKISRCLSSARGTRRPRLRKRSSWTPCSQPCNTRASKTL